MELHHESQLGWELAGDVHGCAYRRLDLDRELLVRVQARRSAGEDVLDTSLDVDGNHLELARLQERVVVTDDVGHRVGHVIVDDVVTTGESTLTAIAAAKEAALQIVKIVVLVDRLEGGTESLQATGLPYESIFSLKDFAAYQDTD